MRRESSAKGTGSAVGRERPSRRAGCTSPRRKPPGLAAPNSVPEPTRKPFQPPGWSCMLEYPTPATRPGKLSSDGEASPAIVLARGSSFACSCQNPITRSSKLACALPRVEILLNATCGPRLGVPRANAALSKCPTYKPFRAAKVRFTSETNMASRPQARRWQGLGSEQVRGGGASQGTVPGTSRAREAPRGASRPAQNMGNGGSRPRG